MFRQVLMSSPQRDLKFQDGDVEETSPQNITLLWYKPFAIIPSRSRRTMWAKYPKNKLVRAVSD